MSTGPSGLNQLKCGVEAFQLDAGIGGCKAPGGLGVVSVAPVKPSRDLAYELGHIGDAAVQALARQDRQLRFRHIEPTAVLGRVVPLCAAENYGGRSNDLTT